MNKQEHLQELFVERIKIQKKIDELIKQSNVVRNKINLLEKQIDIDKRDTLDIVTAHSVVRYLERTLNLDVDELKRQIISDHEDNIKQLMTCRIDTINGILVVKDGYIVTIL
jgi:predicted transcriptional regulator